MHNFIYTIFDRKAAYCLPVFNVKTDTDAMRQFTNIVVNSDTDISKYPADFDLLCIGHIDLDSGFIKEIHPPKTIINGLVALTGAQSDRARYKKVLDGQLDIEDFVQPESAS